MDKEATGIQGVHTELRRLLVARFSEEDLRTLCFELDVPYDHLPGRGMEAKARELIAHLNKRGQLADLVRVGRELRPDIAWPEVQAGPDPEPESRSVVELLSIVTIVIAGMSAILLVFVPAIVPKRVALKTYHGGYVTALGADYNWDVAAETVEIKDFEKFTLIDLGDGKVAFKTFHKRYLSATADGDIHGRPAKILPWETFTLIPLDNGTFALMISHNQYVTALGEDQHYEIDARSTERSLFEEFEIVPLGCFRVMVALGLMDVVDVPPAP